MSPSKQCTGRCGLVLPLDAFSPNARRSDGRQSRCRDCTAADRRDRYAVGASVAADYQRRYERARKAATRRLIAEHRPSFDALLDAELADEGILRRRRRR